MIKELRIIIIEDMPSDVMLVNHELRQSGLVFRSKRIETLDEFVQELECHPPDVILSDHGVPGFDGFAALETARQLCPKVPFIFVTGSNAGETAIETLARGATDYVLKKNLNQLGDAIQRALESQEAICRAPKTAGPIGFPDRNQKQPMLATRSPDTRAELGELIAFVKTTATELRPPAQHIENFSELVLRSNAADLEPKTAHHLKAISDSSHKLNALLDAMDKFVRVRYARISPLDLELREIVDEVIVDLRGALQGREVEWNIGKLPRVSADPAMLSLVLTELLDNALKFSRNQPKSVMEIGAYLKDGETIIYIADNGPGFDQSNAENAFNLFSRLHPQEPFPGLGIGLANVRRIMERHGGRVWAEAVKGRGTRISFSLPRTVREIAENTMQA
jgi:signal transduction histidine kinase